MEDFLPRADADRKNMSKIRSFMPKFKESVPSFQSLKLIPLGGVGDVTKNMYVYEYASDIVIVDCGVGFPDEAMLGIDLVVPDITYLQDKRHKIRGILITHAHDDHIGGLPYIWPQLNCPIYGQKLTCGLIRAKFSEHNISDDKIKEIGLDTQLNLGVFKASFYRVSHSIPDSTGIVLETPVGNIIHQADFKMDWTPINGQVTEVGKVASMGQKGVLLMLIDALRAERKGYNPSEATIQPTFQRIVEQTKNKALITMTSSNLTRVQQALNVALASGRKVSLVGRSMEGNFQVARDLGYLKVPPGLVIAADEIKSFADNKLLILIAGSQGQSGSSLSRAANNDHRFVTLKKDDAIIFSADPIPSTESAQHALIDKLTKSGVDVFYSAITEDVHVSGHASQEELKLMINLAKPKYLMPIGATFRQIKAFSTMAFEMGYEESKILLLEEGKIVDIRKGNIEVDGRVETKNIYVDGLGVGDVGNVVLRDRQVMAEEGIVMVVVPVDTKTGRLAGEPDVVSRGFVFEKESEELLERAKTIVRSALAGHPDGILDWRYTRRHIEDNLEKFLYDETQRRPMILPIVVEV